VNKPGNNHGKALAGQQPWHGSVNPSDERNRYWLRLAAIQLGNVIDKYTHKILLGFHRS
jgi:hypothetical protein